MRVYLLLGGNLGDVKANFEKARAYISEEVGGIVQQSGIYQSQAWGFEAEELFLNQVLLVETSAMPMDLLDITQSIERRIGRKEKTLPTGEYSSRLIDIDILFYGEQIIETERLIIPHKQLHLRRFTLMPLNEIAPNLKHPVLQTNIKDLLLSCEDTCFCKKLQ